METKFAQAAYRHFFIWSICASLAATVCTIVDATLVGNLVGPDGLAVANLSTPVFLLYALLGITIGVGANVRIGRLLGASDVDGANRVFRAQLGFGLFVGALALSPLLFKDAYFAFLGVTQALRPLAERYLTVVMWSAPVFVMYHILAVSVRTDSSPRLAAIASAVVIAANLALDLLFMKALGLGIIGASASLCIAEGLGTLVLLTHFFSKRRLLHLRLALPTAADIRDFLTNGFGMGAENIFDAAVMLVFNTLLLRFGGESGAAFVAIYGVLYTIGTLPAALYDGAANALSTVTSFLTGESDTGGVFAVLKSALASAVIGCGVLAALCAAFPGPLIRSFGIRDPQTIEQAAQALRIFAPCFVFTGVNTAVTAFWQSIGRARLAGAMTLMRNCALVLAVGLLLIPAAAIRGLALAYVIAHLLCMLGSLAVLALRPSKAFIEEKYGMRGRCMVRSYPIRTQSMEQIASDLQAVCDDWAIGMKQAFVINFICEEILLNIIKFGLADAHKQQKEYYISIKLMEKDGGYVLRIRDNVSLYNPFESDGDAIDNGVLRLIHKRTKYCDYQRKMIFNYLYLVI